MSGLFCGGTKPKNNEEYRVSLKNRQKGLGVMAVAGVLTIALAAVLELCNKELMDEYAVGFLSGVGTGLFVGAIAGILKIRRILQNEELLKQCRLRKTDEREREISARAMRAAAGILIAVLYILMVAGSIFSPEMTRLCLVLAAIFFGSYSLLKIYFQKRM